MTALADSRRERTPPAPGHRASRRLHRPHPPATRQIAPHTPALPDEPSPGNPSGIQFMSVHHTPGTWTGPELLPVHWTTSPRVPLHRQPSKPSRRSVPDRPRTRPYFSVVWQLPGRTDGTPGRARRLLTDTCRVWNIPRLVAEDLKLIVSELTTNAVLHAPGEHMTVGLILTADSAWVFCADQGPRRPLRPGPADRDHEHGRGLLLVDALASRCTVTPHGPGTAVAACIPLPPCTADHVHTAEGTVAAAPSKESPDAPHSHI
ncbi:ATP-binding protein [Streptomyces sviceus]|uniref:ATP-binding protein n=1 Tax=Streptomyces sviceus TaxID=285530 RepID=UPI00368724A1